MAFLALIGVMFRVYDARTTPLSSFHAFASRPMVRKTTIVVTCAVTVAAAFCLYAYIARLKNERWWEAQAMRVTTFQQLNDAKIFLGVDSTKLERAIGTRD